MTQFIHATYTARRSGSSAKIEAKDMPLEVNQMIVWLLLNAEAVGLLPEYRRIRERIESTRRGADAFKVDQEPA